MDDAVPRIKNYGNISNYLSSIVKDSKVSQTVFESMDGLIRTLTALIDDNGKSGWAQKVMNNGGNPVFIGNEAKQFEEQLKPFVPMILHFFDKGAMYKGGAMMTRDRLTVVKSDMGRLLNDFKVNQLQETKNNYTSLYDELTKAVEEMKNNKDVDNGLYQEALAYLGQSPNPSTLVVPAAPPAAVGTVEELQKKIASLESEKLALENKLSSKGLIDKPFSLDRTVLDTVKKIYKMDEATQKFATQNFGILKFEHEYDVKTTEPKDPHPFTALRPLPYVGPILAETPVPARLIVMIVYTVLDVARIMISVSPVDSPLIRSILSILLAIADFLKGSWKKSILTLAGVFGQNYVIAGVVGKLILDVISLISPDLQLKIALGMVDVIKSLAAGLLLEIYQTTALAPMREGVIEGFKEIADLVESNKAILAQVEGLTEGDDALPNFLIPSFINIQNIQAVVAHDALVCTTQFTKSIDKMLTDSQGNKNTIMRFILEFLLRVPVDPGTRRVRCPNMPVETDKKENKGNINIDNPLGPGTQETYSKTATVESAKYTGIIPTA